MTGASELRVEEQQPSLSGVTWQDTPIELYGVDLTPIDYLTSNFPSTTGIEADDVQSPSSIAWVSGGDISQFLSNMGFELLWVPTEIEHVQTDFYLDCDGERFRVPWGNIRVGLSLVSAGETYDSRNVSIYRIGHEPGIVISGLVGSVFLSAFHSPEEDQYTERYEDDQNPPTITGVTVSSEEISDMDLTIPSNTEVVSVKA